MDAAEESSLSVLRVESCGREWELERPADLESLWDAMAVSPATYAADFADDERLPYWTELWPSSLVLAEWLYAQKAAITGQPCLDMGCGIGLTTLIGQWIGARVIGMDYERDALHYAARNATRNKIPSPLWVVMDWRLPAVRRESLRFVWGGDIMYERRFAAPVLDFLDYALTRDGIAWVAEPTRAVYAAFRQSLAERRWIGRCVLEQNIEALSPQERPVPVRIWEIHR